MYSAVNTLNVMDILDKYISTKGFYQFDEENNLYILDNKERKNKHYKNGIKNNIVRLDDKLRGNLPNLKNIKEIFTAFDFYLNYKDAKEFAKNVKIDGHDDWRLPTDFEIMDIWKLNKNNKKLKLMEYHRYIYPFWSTLVWKNPSTGAVFSITADIANGNPIKTTIRSGISEFNGSILLVR